MFEYCSYVFEKAVGKVPTPNKVLRELITFYDYASHGLQNDCPTEWLTSVKIKRLLTKINWQRCSDAVEKAT